MTMHCFCHYRHLSSMEASALHPIAPPDKAGKVVYHLRAVIGWSTNMNETTKTLEAFLQQHAHRIDQLIDRYDVPLHVIFLEQFEANATAFQDVLRQCYPNGFVALAVKSNPCRGAVRAASRLDLGADVASENELRLALEEGIPPSRIICNGNAKTTAYLETALCSGCHIAVDNQDELSEIEHLCTAHAWQASIFLRFRGMPLAGLTSADQTTAADWTKFGFHIDEASSLFATIAKKPSVRFRGVSAHIGTQIAEPRGYERLLDHLLSLTEEARTHGLTPDTIDVGGGFPVAFLSEGEWRTFQQKLRTRLSDRSAESVTWNDLSMGYDVPLPADPTWSGKAYWSAVPQSEMLAYLLGHVFDNGRSCVERLVALGSPTLIIEPGRALLATAGVTLTRVAGSKRVLDHHVVALEMGINNHGTNLISPDMFPAALLPYRSDDTPVDAFLAGRLCFSGDMISKTKTTLNRLPKRGDWLVLFHTGAYGADHFASNSCGFLRPGKVAIRADERTELWRAPETFDAIFGAADDTLLIDESSTS